MTRGAFGSTSSLRRSRSTRTSMLRSKISSWSRIACNRYSRESGRPGASRKASSRAYSPLLRATGRSCGSASRRLRRSSRQPSNLYSPCSTSRVRTDRPFSRRRSTARYRAYNSRTPNGLVRQSSAPSSSPTTRSTSSLERPVRIMTGTSELERISRSRSSPLSGARRQLENDRTWVLASQLTDRCRAAGRRDGLYAVLAEIIRDQVSYGRIVIHDQDTA